MRDVRWVLCLLLMAAAADLTVADSADADSADADSGEDRHILLLNSYHQEFSWTEDIVISARRTLRERYPRALIYVEYMDTRRWYDDPEILDHLSELYRHKYQDIAFDLVIASDDNALDYWQDRGREIFSRSGDSGEPQPPPLVISGINNRRPEDVEPLPGVTGIIEGDSIARNLHLIRDLHPEAERIIFLSDKTSFGRRYSRRMRRVVRGLSLPLEYELWDEYSRQELIDRVSRVEGNAVFFILAIHKDSEGEYFNYEHHLPGVCRAGKVPFYGMWKALLGNGVVGGYLNDGRVHGEQAAEMGISILEGTPPEEIPVAAQARYVPLFDYRQVTRFGLEGASFPPESRYIHKPFSFYETYRELVWAVALVVLVLSSLVVLLLVINRRRRQAERQVREINAGLEETITERTRELIQREKTASLGRLVSGLAHHLNTPLGTARTALSSLEERKKLLAEKIDEARMTRGDLDQFLRLVEESVGLAEKNLVRGGDVIREMRKMTPETGSRRPQPVDFEQVLNTAFLPLQEWWDEGGHRLDLEIPPVPRLVSYPVLLSQVLNQLVENSLEHGFSGETPGRVDIRWVPGAGVPPPGGELRYRDNGKGMDPGKLDYIFDPFFQVSGWKEHAGLGLHVVYLLVTKYLGGSIRAELPGEGLEFRIVLPDLSPSEDDPGTRG